MRVHFQATDSYSIEIARAIASQKSKHISDMHKNRGARLSKKKGGKKSECHIYCVIRYLRWSMLLFCYKGKTKRVTHMEGEGRHISAVAPRRVVFTEIRMGECTFG